MDRNLRSTIIVAAIMFVAFVAMCISLVMSVNKNKVLQEELASAQALELAQDAYVRGLQSRLESATKRTNETEILFNFCLEEVDSLVGDQ
jgi:type II secretory pathway pseudopilin PulG